MHVTLKFSLYISGKSNNLKKQHLSDYIYTHNGTDCSRLIKIKEYFSITIIIIINITNNNNVV